MKRSAIVLLASCCLSLSWGQDNPISKFALSANPLGFLQFGPSVSAEIGLSSSLVLNIHLRAPSLGVLSYPVADGPDKLSGIAAGAGLIYFFTDMQHKPYVGGVIGSQKTKNVYDEGEPYEKSGTDKAVYFAVNGGYRFRMNSGFFINTGAYLGAAASKYDRHFKDAAYGAPDSGNEVIPFGMLELSLGFEF